MTANHHFWTKYRDWIGLPTPLSDYFPLRAHCVSASIAHHLSQQVFAETEQEQLAASS